MNSFMLGGIELPLNLIIGSLLFSLFVLLPLIFFRKWFIYRRRLQKNVITAEFVPPLKLTPAEFSYLFDGKFRERAIAATLIHMIQRGLVHMKKSDNKKRVYPGPKMEDNLKSYEQLLLQQVEEDPGVLALKLVDKKQHIEYVESLKVKTLNKLVYTELFKSNHLKKSYVNKFWLRVLKSSFELLVIFVWFPLIFVWLYELLTAGVGDLVEIGPAIMAILLIGAIASPIILFLGLILTIKIGKMSGRTWIIKDKLIHHWPQVFGYRNYLKLLEKNRLAFDNKNLEKSSSNEALAYSVALGFAEDWRKLFE